MNAKYTVYLKSLLDYPETKALIDKALSSYPMYEPKNLANFGLIPKRSELNEKLLNHYKYREIAFETVGRFIDELEIAMNEIMPKYYGLYKSLDILNGIDDPFGNVDIKEIFEEERLGTRTGNTSENVSENTTGNSTSTANSETETNSTTSNKSRNIDSDTPQNKISEIGETAGASNIYASKVGFNDSVANDNASTSGTDTTSSENESSRTGETSSTNEVETSDTVKHTLTKIGNQGVNTYAHDLLELRELFINIEQEIINDPRISELFFMLY